MWSLADRSSRILLWFLILTGLPLAALVWLGWQFHRQDRDLENGRQRERLQNASELLVRDLEAELQAGESALRQGLRPERYVSARGAFFQVRGARVIERSGLRLPFYPVPLPSEDPHASTFAAADRIEFIDGRCDLAARMYRQLSAAGPEEVRAGALMRLARCYRKLGRIADAVDVYGQLTALSGVNVGGVPAEMLALRERIALLTAAGNATAARAETQRLRDALLAGAFMLDRGTFEFFNEKVDVAPAAIQQFPLALAAERVASRWETDRCGRLAGTFARQPILAWWCREPRDTVDVMLIPADDVFGRLKSSAMSLKVAFAVEDPGGTGVWGATPPHGASITRQLSGLGLPWQLRVTDVDHSVAAAQFSRRRTLATTVLVLMVLTVGAAAFFVLRAVNRDLETARLQSDFIGTVSHEFRTPLTAMTHLTEMLKEGAVATERVPQYYDALHRETGRLQRMVEGLLDFKRFEAGRKAYRMEPIDAQETVRQVIDGYTAGDAAQRLNVSLTADARMIQGDRQALAVAISNLLDNALKYSPADTPVSIQVSSRERLLGISVEDRGPGITRNEQRRVFRKFVRGAAAHEGNIKGTGIGLAIVEAVARAHGGRVDLQSVPGQGSRFTLWLPLSPPRP